MTTSSHCLAVRVYFLSKKELEKKYRQWYMRRQIAIQNKGVLSINLHNQGRAGTRGERSLDIDEVVWGEGCMGCTQRSEKKTWDVQTRAPTESHQIGVGEYRATTVKRETIYATMQPPLPPASRGVDGAGSSSGVLEAMVKSSAKKSIGVIVWCVFDRCDGTVLILTGMPTLSFIPRLGTRLS